MIVPFSILALGSITLIAISLADLLARHWRLQQRRRPTLAEALGVWLAVSAASIGIAGSIAFLYLAWFCRA